MTRSRWLLLGLLLPYMPLHAQSRVPAPPASDASPADTQEQAKLDKRKLGYAIGYQIGSQFANGDPTVDIPTMLRAIEDAYAKRPPTVSMRDMRDQLDALDQHMRMKAQNDFQKIAEANARKSADFMSNNRHQPGVVQLPSGIQYSVIKQGEGKIFPKSGSTVTVNYRAMLVDGTEFDNSWAHGAPVSFIVDNKFIPGWQDVIQRMRVGDRWKVVVPPQLAYGERGQLPRIGPNEALVFEIELLEIKQ